MNPENIFLPMLATMALTGIVWVYMYALRIPAMYRVKRHAQTYTVPDAVVEHLPEQVNYPAFNFRNLSELPILFYGLCLYLFATENVDTIYIALAWSFFALRMLHSIVHCTVNIVLLRFYLYAAASLALWVMLGRALIAALTA